MDRRETVGEPPNVWDLCYRARTCPCLNEIEHRVLGLTLRDRVDILLVVEVLIVEGWVRTAHDDLEMRKFFAPLQDVRTRPILLSRGRIDPDHVRAPPRHCPAKIRLLTGDEAVCLMPSGLQDA